jgi:small subunit ribosomal protein S2
MRKELDKLQKTLGGVKYMRRLPQVMIVASAASEKIALAEAKLLRIPTIAITDTDADPTSVTIPVFANDDSNKAVSMIMTLFGDAIATAQGEKALAAYQAEPKFEGIVERERKPRFNKTQRPARKVETK